MPYTPPRMQPQKPTANDAAINPNDAPGAIGKPLDEALATVIVAGFAALAVTPPAATIDRFRISFGSVLRSPGVTDDYVKGTKTTQPSAVQHIVARLQELGIVEGNVIGRLTQKRKPATP